MTVDTPVRGSVSSPSMVLTLGALLVVFRFKIGMLPVLAACSALGLAYGLIVGGL